MSDEKPCGRIHPLPCGVDKDCAFLEGYTGNTKLKELIEEWRDQAHEYKTSYDRDEHAAWGYMMDQCADELEEVIDDG